MIPAVTPISFPATPARPKRKKKTPIQEEDEEDEEDSFWASTPRSKEQSSLMSKFKDIMEKPPSPKVDILWSFFFTTSQ